MFHLLECAYHIVELVSQRSKRHVGITLSRVYLPVCLSFSLYATADSDNYLFYFITHAPSTEIIFVK